MPQPTHAELLASRWAQGDPSLDPALARQLAAAEHRAFAREWATESPFQAAISLPFAIPGYQAGKLGRRAMKPENSRHLPLPMAIPALAAEQLARYSPIHQYLQGTRPSFHQMGEAYRGLGEGLGARLQGLLQ